MTKPNAVHILLTGGTFEKSYDVVAETLDFNLDSIVVSLIEQARTTDTTIQQLMMIDSLYMTDVQRGRIAEAIEHSNAERILIVHGTSTMRDTARFLYERFSTERTIVLTGALVPLRYDAVEGTFNFGLAFAASRYFAPGVYIAMHGLVETPGAISKSADTGQFKLN